MVQQSVLLALTVHFIQRAEAPVLVGAGLEPLRCSCGSVLIEDFQAAQFLGVGIRCGRCGTVTTTAGLPEGAMPAAFLSVAEPASEPRDRAVSVAAHGALVGRAEMERLGDLMRPATPADTVYSVSAELLDRVATVFERETGGALPVAGLRDHALGWSVQHLRERIREPSWACMADAPTANAVTHVAGFLHFVATWSRHPLFPLMLATAGERGFSLHALALFAAAHCMAMAGNRVGFRAPSGSPARVEVFNLALGGTETATVHLGIFDRFEFPFGHAWDQPRLQAAVTEAVAAVQGRINLKAPGVLLLSPGAALPGFDEALIEAVKVSVQALGRANRGLIAVTPVVLRLQALADPHAVRFGYGFFPVRNAHYHARPK